MLTKLKNFEAHFHRKLRTFEKCSNVKKLRTAKPQPIFTGSYKKKKSVSPFLMSPSSLLIPSVLSFILFIYSSAYFSVNWFSNFSNSDLFWSFKLFFSFLHFSKSSSLSLSILSVTLIFLKHSLLEWLVLCGYPFGQWADQSVSYNRDWCYDTWIIIDGGGW